jgi:hypothetical protein
VICQKFEFQTARGVSTRLCDLAADTRVLSCSCCPLDIRGRRECRAPAAPAVSCAVWVDGTRGSHHGHTGSPGIPRAMVLTVSFGLSPVIGLSCHRHLRDISRKLDAGVETSGPHDFAVRVSTVRPRRHPRPSHPAPHVRDDRETPLRGHGTAGDMEVIWVKREWKYFAGRGWTGESMDGRLPTERLGHAPVQLRR